METEKQSREFTVKSPSWPLLKRKLDEYPQEWAPTLEAGQPCVMGIDEVQMCKYVILYNVIFDVSTLVSVRITE
jgi:hypothetical protein